MNFGVQPRTFSTARRMPLGRLFSGSFALARRSKGPILAPSGPASFAASFSTRVTTCGGSRPCHCSRNAAESYNLAMEIESEFTDYQNAGSSAGCTAYDTCVCGNECGRAALWRMRRGVGGHETGCEAAVQAGGLGG